MIEGRFGENGQIYLEVDLIDGDNFSFPVETMLDTGFTEFLAMSKQDIQSLDWTFLGQDKLRTAQGETDFDVYQKSSFLRDFLRNCQSLSIGLSSGE
ncbi:MAG: aspartyl protease [Cuspidothrix sp.]